MGKPGFEVAQKCHGGRKTVGDCMAQENYCRDLSRMTGMKIKGKGRGEPAMRMKHPAID
jgi:hypothetical protein